MRALLRTNGLIQLAFGVSLVEHATKTGQSFGILAGVLFAISGLLYLLIPERYLEER
jgi:uncharacterized protein YjeT (DUF2065 family)